MPLPLPSWRPTIREVTYLAHAVTVQGIRVSLATHFHRADHSLGDAVPWTLRQNAFDLIDCLAAAKWPRREESDPTLSGVSYLNVGMRFPAVVKQE